MSKPMPDFKRMLLRLPHSRGDYAAVGPIAELAGLLSLDLVGVYVEDSSMRGLAKLPHAREFRGGRWQPLNAEQLAQDAAFTVREAERLFLQYAGRRAPAASFSLVDELIVGARETGAEDVIVVIEPINAIERLTHQFNEWLEAAFQSTSSILLVPRRAKWVSGPIIVVASTPDDPCIEAAIMVAAATKEQMIVVPSRPPTTPWSAILERARTVGIATSLTEAVFHQGDILLPALVKGRLLIMGREQTAHRLPQSQVPILLLPSKLPAPPTSAEVT